MTKENQHPALMEQVKRSLQFQAKIKKIDKSGAFHESSSTNLTNYAFLLNIIDVQTVAHNLRFYIEFVVIKNPLKYIELKLNRMVAVFQIFQKNRTWCHPLADKAVEVDSNC